jgi:predicted membrane-bound dolichyl-phosphate-mannose-protein mannosyltransferase
MSAYLQGFNPLALILPAALIVFVVFFFRAYFTDKPSHQEKHLHVRRRARKLNPPQLHLPDRPGRMTGRDWLIAAALTFAYGILAFSFAGDTTAPQTFWRATKEQPSLELDLGEEIRLQNLYYYPGFGEGQWFLELSADGQEWEQQTYMGHLRWHLFSWAIPLFKAETTKTARYIRLTMDTQLVETADLENFRREPEADWSITGRDGTKVLMDWMELGELAVITQDKNGNLVPFDLTYLTEKYPQYKALFDEQNTLPDFPLQDNHPMYALTGGKINSHNSGTRFDESEHAETAYAYIRELPPDESTHPPLGKAIISLGIRFFGMTPFGMRFMGILFGALMLPLLYVLIKNLFDNTTVAVFGTILLAFENMHFTQTHLATVDTYVVFFIMAMYLFMYRYISSGCDTPFVKTLPPLFLSGLSFGLAAATKWSGIFAALGLVAMYAVYLVKRYKHQASAGKKPVFRAFLSRTLAASAVCFVIVPFIIYTLSYIPYTNALGRPKTSANLLGDMWHNMKNMLWYHGNYMSASEHEFQSSWWMWVLNIRPVLYLRQFTGENSRAFIGAFTNPLVAISGLVALGVAIYDAVRKRFRQPFFIAVGYLAQLAPWVFIARTSFVYHYFPAVIFLVLAVCYVFYNILMLQPERKKQIFVFTGAAGALFLLFLPITVGISIPDWYAYMFLKWLPSWPF